MAEDDKLGFKIGMGLCIVLCLAMIYASTVAPPNERAGFGGLALVFFVLACILGAIAFSKKEDPPPSTNP